MRPRIAVARLCLRLSDVARSMPVAILRPHDMVQFSRQAYERGASSYARLNDPDRGLSQDEMILWEQVPCRTGRLMVLGGGGGREALFFARQGFKVTGIDFSERMLAQARECAARSNLGFTGILGDISRVEAPGESFDVVWFSMFLYSVVLNRKRRIAMLHRVGKALKPGGVLVCSFHWDPSARFRRRKALFLRALAWLTLGHTGYENGDILFGTIEFRHAFGSEADLHAEFAAGALEVIHLTVFDDMMRGGAVLRKPARHDNNV